MRRVIADIETESLDPSIIWIVACKDIDSGEVVTFIRPDLSPAAFLDYASTVGTWVGHNFLAFDLPVLRRLVPGLSLSSDGVVDTLVVSRLLHFDIDGGHSLEAWGKRLGCAKPVLESFSSFTPEMVERVVGDVELNYKLYLHYQKYIESEDWAEALWIEHQMVLICQDMHHNGFPFDIVSARRLYEEVCTEVQTLEAALQEAFPPRSRLIREVTPKETKHGTLSLTDFRWLDPPVDLSPYSAGAPFSRIEFVPFNPASPKQVVERLNEAGWKPVEKTKGHLKELRKWGRDRDNERREHFAEWGWQISETNLDTVPDTAPPAARKLKDYLTLLSRQRKLEEWFKVFDVSTGRIHGQFHPIGAWTHRMAHSAPNMGNNVALNKRYGTEMRQMWQATPGRVLVGTDMASAHLRLFAHLINDPVYIKAVTAGSEETGDDPHTLNALALGLEPKKQYANASGETGRKLAKIFIYSFLNGAAAGKVAEILCCSISEAHDRLAYFEEQMPAYRELRREKIPFDARRGFFIGLDGRKVLWDNEHGMLAGYLQNGEAICMKHANILWRTNLDIQHIPYWQLNFVHDEWQTETEKEYIEEVQKAQIWALEETGRHFNLLCPITGSSKSGINWAETH